MCGRYYIDAEDSAEELRRVIDQINRKQAEEVKLGEIAPSEAVPVVDARGARLMRWGFARPGGKGIIINARMETLLERPMFRDCLKSRRLVVPASGYYEWMKTPDGGKQKYAFTRDGEPIYMAGLWRQEPDQELPAFVILTTDAAPAIREIHDRMPVLLHKEHLRAWLRDDAEAERILRDRELEIRFGIA